MKKTIKYAALLLGAALILILLLSRSGYSSENRMFFAMDTVIDISMEARDSSPKLDALEQLINELDSELSRTLEGSLIYRLNHSLRGSAELSADALELLNEAKELRDFTEGAFDISIAPVMDLWGFTSGEYQVPEPEEISEALGKLGMEHIHIKNDIVSLDEGCKLDLGGIAKGYALEKTRDFFRENHVKNGLAYMGGDILAYGSKEGGKGWVIAVEDPKKPAGEEGYIGTLSLKNSYITTSGNYQRYFIQDGVRYHHIIDPATGRPADNGINSVTIVADMKKAGGPMCDALSTALFVMGKDRAAEFWRNNPDLFEFIIVTDDNEILLSKGLEGVFNPVKNDKYELKVIF